MASKPISIEITGDAKKFTQEMSKVDASLGKIGRAAGVAGLAIAGGIAAGGVALFSIGQQFEEMEDIIIKGTGASGEALEGLVDSMKGVMGEVPDSGEVVAGALADVNTFFGSTGTELEGLTEQFLDFSRLTGTEVGANIDGLDGIMTSFNLTTGDANELMGDLIRISQATGVPMEALIGTVDKYGPSFEAAGLSAEQAAIMIGEFAVAGLDAEGTGKILDKVLLDAASNGISAEEAMANLDAQLGAMTSAERLAAMEQMVGGRNASQAVAAWEAGALSIDQINASIGDGAGVLEAQTEATETFSDKWNQFKNKVLVKLEPLATKLFEKLTEGMDWIESDGIPAVEKMVEKFQEFGDWVQENIGWIGPLLLGLGVTIGTILVAAFVSWAIAAGAAAIATIAAMAPVILVGVAIGALAVLIWKLWTDWDNIWSGIKKLTGQVVDWVKDKLSSGWEAVKGLFSGLKDSAIQKFTELKTGVVNKARELATDVKNYVAGIPQKIKDLGTQFLDAGKTVGGKILTGIKDGLTAAVGFAGDVATGVWTKVKNAVNTNVIDKVNDAIPNSISMGFLGSIDLPDNPIPRLFKGTNNFAGGLAMVGEMGREMVALPQGAQVLSNRDTEKALGRSGPTTVNVSVQSNANPHEIARELAWSLRTSGR